MNVIDRVLKFLGTDRNTFLTYILTLATIYFVVDRTVEILLICFTGIGVTYWGPIHYTIALACPVFAFLFSSSSKFAKNDNIKFSFFYLYCIALYILTLSMFVTWINELIWVLMMYLPNYSGIVSEFPELVKSALTALALYLPIVTAPIIFKKLYMSVNDSKTFKDSIIDYKGIDLSPTPEGIGEYTCEMLLCTEKETGRAIKTPETKRYESTLVVGVSGSGKTSMIFEPMIARDLEKKFFFQEMAKEMGFTALKTGIATLHCPYDNDYINKNFSLNMLQPNPSKEKLYHEYMKKMIHYTNGSQIIYKNLGLTYMAPDDESAKKILKVAKNFGIPVNSVDPSSLTSVGLNPFVYEDPIRAAIIISSVLKGMLYLDKSSDSEDIYKQNVALQAVENVAILLKEMYPRLKDGILPNLSDLLKCLNDFDLVEALCEKMQTIPDLAEKYAQQLSYFKKTFYHKGVNRTDTEKYLFPAINQLDSLLRNSGVRNVLCNRTNNVNFDDVLKDGQVTVICTRRGELGGVCHKAFGLFFLLSLQHCILSRPGSEKSRIPHFLYIDEFPTYICHATEALFTLYRKYRVGSVVSAQSLAQLGGESNEKEFRDIILSNCGTKIVFGSNTPEENNWWEKELGQKRDWKSKADYNLDKGEYEHKLGGVEYGWIPILPAGKLQTLPFKTCGFKTKDIKGRVTTGHGVIDFLAPKYNQPQETKFFNFTKFTPGVYTEQKEENKLTKVLNKLSGSNEIPFDNIDDNVDPIQTSPSSSKYLFKNKNSISFDLSDYSQSSNTFDSNQTDEENSDEN